MADAPPAVPAPEPPDSPDAWYAPDVHDQYALGSGVVATVRSDAGEFAYDVREPSLSARAESDLHAVLDHFADAEPRRPRTRQGAAERLRAGFDPKYERAIDRLVDCSPTERRRLEDLLYYVLRDLTGYSQLTVPIRDPNLEDIEANAVDERLKVVPRGGTREPANLRFDDEAAFVNVVTQLAARDGVELSVSRPSAKVNLDPQGLDQTIRCAVALPTISEGGPHISIRKQAPDVLTPVDLVEADSMPTELVTLLWMRQDDAFHGPSWRLFIRSCEGCGAVLPPDVDTPHTVWLSLKSAEKASDGSWQIHSATMMASAQTPSDKPSITPHPR